MNNSRTEISDSPEAEDILPVPDKVLGQDTAVEEDKVLRALGMHRPVVADNHHLHTVDSDLMETEQKYQITHSNEARSIFSRDSF